MITWTCSICGHERPDDMIVVEKRERRTPRGATVGVNVRHCVDRAPCIAGAIRMADERMTAIMQIADGAETQTSGKL